MSIPFLLFWSSWRWRNYILRVVLGGTGVNFAYALPIFFWNFTISTSTRVSEKESSLSEPVAALLLPALSFLLFLLLEVNPKLTRRGFRGYP